MIPDFVVVSLLSPLYSLLPVYGLQKRNPQTGGALFSRLSSICSLLLPDPSTPLCCAQGDSEGVCAQVELSDSFIFALYSLLSYFFN